MSHATVSFIILVIMLPIFGCSGSGIPTEPESASNQTQTGNNDREGAELSHFVFATTRFEYDAGGEKLIVVPLHSAWVHYNVTPFITPPNCTDCITVELLWHDPVAKSAEVKITLRNPSPLTAYDVRGMMYGGLGLRVLDSDGFTKLFAPQPGAVAAFLAYAIEKPDADFTPGYSSERTYSLTYEDFTDLAIDFVVEGSFPNHCREPAIVRVYDIDDDELTIWGGTATITIEAIDRQDNLAAIVAGAPDIFDGNLPLTDVGNNLYRIEFSNENFTPAGVHPVVFTSWSYDDPNNLAIGQVAFVEVKTAPYEDTFYGSGHPMEGVNTRRNNRSNYLLPTSLTGDDHVEIPMGNYGTVQDFVVSEDERLYLSRRFYEGYCGGPNADYVENFKMWVFDFGDDFGVKNAGGIELVLTIDGIYTISRSDNSSWSYGPLDPSVHINRHSSMILYDWPAVHTMVSYGWGRDYEYIGPDTYWGSWDAPRFHHFLPLPGGRVVTAHRKENWNVPFLGLWDENFELSWETEFSESITGFAFDGDDAVIYAATGEGLYCYDWGFTEKWNSNSTYPDFTNNLPVIADDGGVLGCFDGVLRRIEPDGTPGPQVDCGAYMRPCILMDGTIAVITDSTIKYFDSQLSYLDEIPLPSGADTGHMYGRPPLADAADNMALYNGAGLYVIDKDGNILDQHAFDTNIHHIRLGPEHLFVVLDYAIYRFPN